MCVNLTLTVQNGTLALMTADGGSNSHRAQSTPLSYERKISMVEAREAIIDRLARDLPTNIDLERFLNVVVSEIGRMLHGLTTAVAASQAQGRAGRA